MTQLAERLDSLLESEREALLQGDLERIGQIMEEKQALVDSLDDSEETARLLLPMRDRIRRNNTLFDQALSGLRMAVARLGALHGISKAVHAYDASGQRFSISQPIENKLEKRA